MTAFEYHPIVRNPATCTIVRSLSEIEPTLRNAVRLRIRQQQLIYGLSEVAATQGQACRQTLRTVVGRELDSGLDRCRSQFEAARRALLDRVSTEEGL